MRGDEVSEEVETVGLHGDEVGRSLEGFRVEVGVCGVRGCGGSDGGCGGS